MSRQTMLISALVAVLVIALWWVFLFNPGQDELAMVEDEIAAAETEQTSLEQRIASLEMVRSRAPETEAAIAALRAVVPDDPALPAALRQLVAAAEDSGIEIDSVATARPEVVDEGVGLNAANVTLTVSGSYFQLVDFLRRVEDPSITARGIVFRNLTVTAEDPPTLTISISGDMYAALEPPPTPPEDDAAVDGEATDADAADDTADDGEATDTDADADTTGDEGDAGGDDA